MEAIHFGNFYWTKNINFYIGKNFTVELVLELFVGLT